MQKEVHITTGRRVHMLGTFLVYAGFLAMCAGAISQIRPLPWIKIRNFRVGLQVFAVGVVVSATGFAVPSPARQVKPQRTHLDEFSPVYQFEEFHSIKVNAPREKVYDAIRAVTAEEISWYRTLTWMRRLGRSGKESILNPPAHEPLLDVAMRSGFLLLAAEPNREIVLGTAVLAPADWQPMRRVIPADFKALDEPGFALATMNFRIEDEGTNSCLVTTETRVYATDPASQRKFAQYWRMIYPGSALIRRMWLKAIRTRAETP
jgi:hypothetical protein